MAKRTILELENGKIEISHDGETEIYLYQDTPFSELSDEQIKEIRESKTMQEFVKKFNVLAEILTKVFRNMQKQVVPVFNKVLKTIEEAEEEAKKSENAKKAIDIQKGKKDAKK